MVGEACIHTRTPDEPVECEDTTGVNAVRGAHTFEILSSFGALDEMDVAKSRSKHEKRQAARGQV